MLIFPAVILSMSMSLSCSDSGGDGDIRYRPDDPRAQALWDAPTQCGAAAYQWVDDPALGTIVDWFADRALDTAAIEAALNAAEFAIPRDFIHNTRSYRMRYVTQDRGALTEATALVALPDIETVPPGGLPVLLYLHGTTGFSDDCAPSAGLLDPFAIAALSSMGYAVIAPDYLGMNSFGGASTQLHPYLVPEPTAIASLDAVRAARALVADSEFPQPLTLDSGTLLLGGSQGGHAALFTARYAPYYAAEQTIIAVAASVPPADLATEFTRTIGDAVNGTANAAAALTALADWYGVDTADIFLPPYAEQVRTKMESECGLGGLLDGASTVEEVFTADIRALAADDFSDSNGRLSCIIQSSSVLKAVEPLNDPPILFVLSELDELVSTPIQREAFDALCAQGLSLAYLECAGTGHTEGAVGSIVEQLDFLDARLAGEPLAEDARCQRTDPVVCSGTMP